MAMTSPNSLQRSSLCRLLSFRQQRTPPKERPRCSVRQYFEEFQKR